MHTLGMTGVKLYESLIKAGEVIPTILITAYRDDRVKTGALDKGVSLTPLSHFGDGSHSLCSFYSGMW
jgi:hypothetical protein